MDAADLTGDTARMLRRIAEALPLDARTDRAIARRIAVAALTLEMASVAVNDPETRNSGHDSTRCWECGDPSSERAHLIPRLRGGRSTVPLCGPCHGRMHDMKRSQDIGALTREGLAAARARGRTGGRPHAATADQLDAARALVAAGRTVAQAAQAIGVGRSTLYRHLDPPTR